MKHFGKILSILFSAFWILFAFGCDNYWQEGKLRIITSLYPHYEFAKIIARDKADVKLLLNPGMDSHSFEPSGKDIANIDSADIFIYTGEQMEQWAARILDALDNGKLKAVSLIDTVEIIENESNNEEEQVHSHSDSHIWLNINNAVKMVSVIRDAIIQADSSNTEFYTANASDYIEQLNLLNNDITEAIQASQKKTLVFAGQFAFIYFLHEYGLEDNYISVFEGCSEDEEPTGQNIGNIIDFVSEADNNIEYIFYDEYNANPVYAKQVQDGARDNGVNIELLQLHSLQNLSDAERKQGKNFIGIMRNNLNNILLGLG